MRLFLCEKPSQARDIARVLSATARRNGYFAGPSVAVTWCIGHLLEAVEPAAYEARYKRWSIDSLPIVPLAWKAAVKPSCMEQFAAIKQLLQTATEVVISTDADREGEMIAREVLEMCSYRGPVKRLWLSALNDASIRTALANLRDGRDTLPLYHAALARSRADWLIGMNLTRLFTLLGQQAGHSCLLSVGRVQTPTLRLVVERDRAIEGFVSVPYWSVDVKLRSASQSFVAQWIPPAESCNPEGRCLRQEVANDAEELFRTARRATVSSLETQRVREPPPLPFDLSTLQELCSRRLGLDVMDTLNIAQALYESHKACTYPRTDSRHLPENMLAEADRVLAALLKSDPALHPTMSRLNSTQQSRAFDDAKVTAHHAIIPTAEPVNLSAMSDRELAVYKLIRSYYLAQFMPHHEYERTLAQLTCDSQRLQSRGKQVLAPGWRGMLEEPSPDDEPRAAEQALPAVQVGQVCEILDTEMRSLHTSPPRPFTQGDLIRAMKDARRWIADPRLKAQIKESIGIGTEATQAGIVAALLQRGYLIRSGKALQSSPIGRLLIDAVPAEVADPGTTVVWEQKLELIAAGRLTLADFVHQQASWLKQMIDEHSRRPFRIPLAPEPRCPKCNSAVRARHGKRGAFYSCTRYPQCRGILPISQCRGPLPISSGPVRPRKPRKLSQ